MVNKANGRQFKRCSSASKVSGVARILEWGGGHIDIFRTKFLMTKRKGDYPKRFEVSWSYTTPQLLISFCVNLTTSPGPNRGGRVSPCPMATPMSKVAEESLSTTSKDRMLQFSPWHNLCISHGWWWWWWSACYPKAGPIGFHHLGMKWLRQFPVAFLTDNHRQLGWTICPRPPWSGQC